MNSTNELTKQFKKQFYLKNKLNLLFGLLSMVLLAVGSLLVSWMLQQVIDVASGANSRFTLLQLALLSVAITVGIVISFLLQYHTIPRFIQRAIRQYKDYAFDQLTKKSIHSFTKENTSTYISTLSNDATSIENNYLAKLFPVVQDVLLFVGAFALMLYYSPFLTLIAVLLSLFPVIASILTGSKLAVQEKAVSDRNESFMDTIKDMLSGFSVIKSFQSEPHAYKLFANSNKTTEDAKCKRRKIEILILLLGTVAGIIAQFGVFLIGAYFATTDSTITAGVVIIFVQLMNFVLTPISSVPAFIANKQATNTLLQKMASVIGNNVRKEGTVVDTKLTTAITLKDVSFSYEENHPVLKHIDMNFEVGKSYAIVGGSGSGKSTLLNLLVGSHEDYEGHILYDSTELRDIRSDCLYSLISMVEQNVFIFNETVLHNMTMFQSFPPEKLSEAIHLSGLDTLIKERGSEYRCGENGNGLSGGERQRISIARCLLRNAPVMLVDEATASLDAQTSYSISNSILDLHGLTRIVVTHKLEESLLRKYDKIYVLKDGCIKESGTFTELMNQKEYFYSLYTVAQ